MRWKSRSAVTLGELMLDCNGGNPQVIFADTQLSHVGSTALGFVFWGVAIEDCRFEIAVNFGGGFVDGVDV